MPSPASSRRPRFTATIRQTGKSSVFRQPKVDFDPSKYETKQVFYNSKDGTRVPMFLTYKKGLKLNGQNPTLLYGYGGFDISLTPSFSVPNRGVAGDGRRLRAAKSARRRRVRRRLASGGDAWQEAERVRRFHRGGGVADREQVHVDAEAGDSRRQQRRVAGRRVPDAASGLIRRDAARGRRDGHAALPQVHDRLGVDFGLRLFGQCPRISKALYAYSPLHNLKAGTKYPPTLIATADHDDRVVPGHSFKFAATMQADQAGPAPVLIRIETKAGHGAGKPISKIIEETADEWAFVAHNLGMDVRIQ